VSFLDLASELSGQLPGLPPLLAEQFVNRAWQKVRSSRAWSFLIADATVLCPPILSGLTASIVRYSAQVTCDATLSNILNTHLTYPPLTLTLQFRVVNPIPSSGFFAGGIYNILAVDATAPAALVLTLDRVIEEQTSAVALVQIYRCYIIPPEPDFLSWISLVDVTTGYSISGDRLLRSSLEFDRRDPQRQAQGQAYYLGLYRGNAALAAASQPVSPFTQALTTPQSTTAAGQPIYELWPHPTTGQTFYCRYRRRGADLSDPTDELPPGVPDDLVIQLALLHHGYPWAMANAGAFPAYRGINFALLMQQARLAVYGDPARGVCGLLQDVKRQDDTQALQSVINRGHLGYRQWGPGWYQGPIDASFIQRHAIYW
jgi:hypothetical protein